MCSRKSDWKLLPLRHRSLLIGCRRHPLASRAGVFLPLGTKTRTDPSKRKSNILITFVKCYRFDVTTYEGADELWSSVPNLLDRIKHIHFLFLLSFADDVFESAE